MLTIICPGFSVSEVLTGSILITAIGYLEHIAIGQSFAVKSSYQIDNSQVIFLPGLMPISLLDSSILGPAFTFLGSSLSLLLYIRVLRA